MKNVNTFWRILLVGALLAPYTGKADDIIPSVAKEDMAEYKNAFGKAIADSKKAEREENAKEAENNFGSKVSDAARNLKADILKENKNFGAWVSKQRSQRPDDAGAKGAAASTAAKSSTTGGRPEGVGRPDSPGNQSGSVPTSPGKSDDHKP